MITPINYLLFSSDELSTFASSASSITEAKKTQIPTLLPFLANTNQKYILFRSALERESKNPFTKEQGAKDMIRNNAFLTFRSACESASTRTKEGYSAAGNVILDVIRKQDWSAQLLGMKTKSSVINGIISEIRSKHAPELTLLGVGELLDELETAEENFKTVSQQKVEVASTTKEPTVNETRPELVAALRAMLQFIGLQQIAAPSADVTALIASLNELITTSLSTAKAAGTRSENTKKAAEAKATETTK